MAQRLFALSILLASLSAAETAARKVMLLLSRWVLQGCVEGSLSVGISHPLLSFPLLPTLVSLKGSFSALVEGFRKSVKMS